MAQPRSVVPLEVIRAAARTAIETTSLRQVAREMGLTPSGLEVALVSHRPRYRTLRHMQEWYVRRVATLGGADADTARAAFAVLFESLPSQKRETLLREVLIRIGAAHRESGSRPPDWLAELAGAKRSGEGDGNGSAG